MSRLEVCILGAAVVLLCALYMPLMMSEPILSRDDRTMITTLKNACEAGYWASFKQGNTLDVQPLRDLSLWIDGWLEHLLGFRPYHVTQMALWIACAGVLHRILRSLDATPLLRTGLTCLFLFHPASVASVAWIASRKHLLACLFLGSATWRVVRWETHAIRGDVREAFIVGMLYMLAMASQPLGIGWPIWMAWFVYARSIFLQKRFKFLLACAIIPTGFLVAWSNHYYYAVLYPLKHGGQKFYAADVLSHFFAFGRYFTQLVFPVSISTTPYLPRSPLNVVGLAGFVGMTLAIWLSSRRRARSVWLVLYMVAIAPVTVTMTNIFGSDTYLLIPLMSLCCLIGDRACFDTEAIRARYGRILTMTLVATVTVFAAISFAHVDDWMDDARFWRASYREGPTLDNMTHVAYYDLEEGHVDEALVLAQRVYVVNPTARNLGLVLPEAIFRSTDPALDVRRKLEMLGNLRMASPWPAYYTAILYGQAGDLATAWSRMQQLLNQKEPFGDRQAEVFATALQMCRQSHAEQCERLLPH